MKVLYIHKKCVQLYTLQEGKCFYCQIKYEYQRLTRDHFNPLFKGGKNQYNVVLACGDCNSSKGHKTIQEFREFINDKLVTYIEYFKTKGIIISPKDKYNKVNKYKAVVERCDYLLKNTEEINSFLRSYYKIDYKKALDELGSKNKLVPYLMTKYD